MGEGVEEGVGGVQEVAIAGSDHPGDGPYESAGHVEHKKHEQ